MSQTTSEMVREFLREQIAEATEIDTAALVRKARKHFSRDDGFIDALIRESIHIIVTDQLAQLVRLRREVRKDADLRAQEILALVFEPVGGGLRKSILTMKRPDLRYAANEREHQAAGLLKWARFERDLAGRMRDDEQTVGERFTDAQLDTIWNTHFESE